jgi:hypothetical protein
LAFVVGLVLAGVMLADKTYSQSRPEAGPATPQGFSPVAPVTVLHAAQQANLKLVRDWLNDKDYASAAEAAQGLLALTQLYQYHSAEPAWRQKTTALREACSRLMAAARAKDLAGCTKSVQDYATLLTELAKAQPGGSKADEPNFKPLGSVKTWMLLMDGCYGDAKFAETPQELESLAYALAEGANVTIHLRADARWRQAALETRAAALATVQKAQSKDLDGARASLKTVYHRCEACHNGYRQR